MTGVPIDLRSDTVTRPSERMRAVIASAPVGDDQFGEDPTVNRLQERVAQLLGKERALWLPSGTMANQVALRTLARPGDDIIVARESHVVWHETGGASANAGVQLTEIGAKGRFTLEEFLAARKPRGHMLYPPTTVVWLENTHNRAGGVVLPQEEAEQICAAAAQHGLRTYLDGARLWNAAVAARLPVDRLAAPFDLVAVAFSKGLGAPGGSALAGSDELIAEATRYRRMMGGAMRQVGIFAAASLYALDHNVDRLARDHALARQIAEQLAESPGIDIDLTTVQTNIVVFGLAGGGLNAVELVARAKDRGVLVVAFGPRTVRVVTHLDVSEAECKEAARVLVELADAAADTDKAHTSSRHRRTHERRAQ